MAMRETRLVQEKHAFLSSLILEAVAVIVVVDLSVLLGRACRSTGVSVSRGGCPNGGRSSLLLTTIRGRVMIKQGQDGVFIKVGGCERIIRLSLGCQAVFGLRVDGIGRREWVAN